ncbi:MAG: hypothetical protein LUE23_09275 [Lachnospiraceae bacterium]|nr:hypothetical protein [Lachnospiraceae bacterium]
MKKYVICLLAFSVVIALALAGWLCYLSLRTDSQAEENSAELAETAAEAAGEDLIAESGESEEAPAKSGADAEESGAAGGYQAVLLDGELRVYEETTGELIESLPAEDLWIPEAEEVRLREGISFQEDEELYQYLESLTS